MILGDGRFWAPATVLLLTAGPALAQQMTPPAVGNRYSFDCQSGGRAYQEEYRIAGNDGGMLRVEVTSGNQNNWYEKPFYLSGTTIVRREEIAGRTRDMSYSGFEGLEQLDVGASFNSYVRESRSSGEKLSWNYTVAVTGREAAYVRGIGDLKVVAIDEERWVNQFSSKMLTHYSPELAFPVFWSYRDSNGGTVECTMASAEMTAAPAVAAAPPQPAPVAQPKPKPKPAPQVAAKPPAKPTPPPQPAVRPAPQPQPQPQTAAVAPGRPAPAAKPSAAPAPSGPVSVDKQHRLQQLTELRNLGLINQEEYGQKRDEILGEPEDSAIAQELEAANRQFVQKQISPEDFIARRAAILAKIDPALMPPKDGLVLLNLLLEKALISRLEYDRKRDTMLAAL
jgi:hypothetical protein